jgi:integrase
VRPQKIDVFGVQDRRKAGRPRPWAVRWRVDGRMVSRSFRTRVEADRFRSLLVQAVTAGVEFDARSCEPASWTEASEVSQLTVFEWCRRWLAEQWPEWQPRTRRSAIEAISRLVPLAVVDEAPAPPKGVRAFLVRSLDPMGDIDEDDPAHRWISRHGLKLAELNKANLARVDLALGQADDGTLLGARTAGRRRTVARSCIRRAVQLDLLAADPWPPTVRGRAARKVNRRSNKVDVHALPDPGTMVRILRAMATHQPGSLVYQQMTAVVYFAGLRPSEVVMLRRRSVHLPPGGAWGRIDVTEADIDNDTPGEPKTGPRSVPIPPILVHQLRSWLDDHPGSEDTLLFRTRAGTRPSSSNWTRAWRRALDATGNPGWRIYDCRHAAATTWLASGAPLGEVARRLGHTVDTLVSVYVGALSGDESVTNQRIADTLDAALNTNTLRVA